MTLIKSSPVKIALDARYVQEHFPGIGRYVYGLVKGLAELKKPELNFELSLIYNPARPDLRHNLTQLVAYYPERLKLLNTPVKPFSISEQVQLAFLARRQKFSLWHAPYYIRPYWLPCPSVLTAHDVIAARLPEVLPSPKARLAFEAATRLAFLSSKKIITGSNSARTDIVQLYKVRQDKVKVIPDAVEEKFRPLLEREKVEARARLNLPQNYLIYVGINKPHKNILGLLEAFKLYRERVSLPAVLILAGREDQRYASDVRRKAAELGLEDDALKIWGEINEADLRELYGCATLFIFPSLYEGFGLPVLEAMACGIPVICADNSSLPEVAGEAALLFKAEDTAALAKLIVTAMQSPELRANLTRKGLERAGLFSWQRTAEQTLAVYRETLNL